MNICSTGLRKIHSSHCSVASYWSGDLHAAAATRGNVTGPLPHVCDLQSLPNTIKVLHSAHGLLSRWDLTL